MFYTDQFLVPQSKGRILGHKWSGGIPPNILNPYPANVENRVSS